jgi:hypothetical protein
MIDAADLPEVQAQLARDAAALKERHSIRAKAMAEALAPQFARAPAAAGPQPVGARPAATQRNDR